MAKGFQDVLFIDNVEHAISQHAGVFGFSDQKFDRDRVEPSKAMYLVKADFGNLVGRIVGVDVMQTPFGLAADVVARWTEIVQRAIDVDANKTFWGASRLTQAFSRTSSRPKRARMCRSSSIMSSLIAASI